MDMVCGGYLECVIANILLSLWFGVGWIFIILFGFIFHRIFRRNHKFRKYNRFNRFLISMAASFILAFLVVSILYAIYGKGSESTGLGF